MIKTKDIRNHIPRLKMGKHHIFAGKLNEFLDQQEKVNELLKEHIQLSYDLEYMLVHGIKDDMKYTKTANRLFTVREKLQDVLNWKLESELK
ncbi:MAG: hypothetical protein QXI16_02250 [Sulfolobaceae archaeon]